MKKISLILSVWSANLDFTPLSRSFLFIYFFPALSSFFTGVANGYLCLRQDIKMAGAFASAIFVLRYKICSYFTCTLFLSAPL